METRKLSNGWIAKKAKSPTGDGVIMYVESGPEGLAFAFDTNMFPIPVLNELLGFAGDTTPPKQPADPHLKPVFDKNGFRY